jgi:hypothetical protein
MTDESKLDSVLSRRTFNKGAIASGAAALGLAGVSGSAAAQQGVKNLQLGDVQLSEGLLTINVQNLNVLRNVRDNVQDVVVTVIGDDAEVLNNVLNDADVDVEDVLVFQDRVINIDLDDVDVNVDALNDLELLNDSVVQVSVAVLGESDPLAQGVTFDSI